jgi:hypothetical protein
LAGGPRRRKGIMGVGGRAEEEEGNNGGWRAGRGGGRE